MQFHKYTALGNDMIVIDPNFFHKPLTPERIKRICDRHFGAGADGIVYGPLTDGETERPTMRFFNPDGTEAERSGNGLRIFARYLLDAGIVNAADFTVADTAGLVQVNANPNDSPQLAITLGIQGVLFVEDLSVDDEVFSVTAVSVGNPHAVIFTNQLIRIHDIGPLLENGARFPDKTNVQLVQVINPHTLRIEIWERGAGYTLASGTSASATAVAAVHHGHCPKGEPITVQMAGGMVQVIVYADSLKLIGEVTAVYSGTLAPDFFSPL